jgi:hypothetical protein
LQGDGQCFGSGWASSLDDIDDEAAVSRSDGQSQRGGRSILRASERPHEDKERFGCLSRKVQSPQRLGPDVLLPQDEGAATLRLKHALRAPECVRGLRCPQSHEPVHWQAEIRERQRIEHVRWLKQRNRPRDQFGERRLQEPHLAYPWLLDQQFHQCAQRPATAGQFG